MGGGGALATVGQRGAVLPLGRAEMAAGQGRRPVGQAAGCKAGRQRQPLGHGAARPVQPGKGHIQLAHGVMAGGALALQVAAEHQTQRVRRKPGPAQQLIHALALQLALCLFPGGLAKAVVLKQQVEPGGKGAFALLFAAHGGPGLHRRRPVKQNYIASALGHGAHAPFPASAHPGAKHIPHQPPQAAGGHAVHDHRPGNEKQLGSHAGDEALFLELDGGADHRIGEPGDGHQRAGSGLGRQFLVQPQPGEQPRQGNEGHAGEGAGVGEGKALGQIGLPQPLAQQTDGPAHKKGPEAVLPEGRRGRSRLDHGFVLLRCKLHGADLLNENRAVFGVSIPKRKKTMHPAAAFLQNRRVLLAAGR